MISVPRFRRFLRTDSTQATQNFTIGVILDAESDGTKIFWKLENFTISRNKVRVQPLWNKIIYRNVINIIGKIMFLIISHKDNI